MKTQDDPPDTKQYGVNSPSPLLLTGYDGGLPGPRGRDGDGDVHGVAVEAGLAGPAGVLQVVRVLLLLVQTQPAAQELAGAGGRAIQARVSVALPGGQTDGRAVSVRRRDGWRKAVCYMYVQCMMCKHV